MNFKANNPVDISLVKEFVYTAKKDAFAGSGKKVTLNNQNSVFSLSEERRRCQQYAWMILLTAN